MIAVIALAGCFAPAPRARPTPIAPTAPLCPNAPVGAGSVDLTLVAGDGIDDPQLDRAVGLLTGRLARQGITVERLLGVRAFGARYALGRRPGVPGAPLGPLADWVPDDATVHLLIVEQVVDPGAALAGEIVLAGVGIPPRAEVSPAVRRLQDALPDGAPPWLVVDRDALVDPRTGGDLLVHELGHALGLPHDPASAVATTAASGCTPGFTAAQLQALGWSAPR